VAYPAPWVLAPLGAPWSQRHHLTALSVEKRSSIWCRRDDRAGRWPLVRAL